MPPAAVAFEHPTSLADELAGRSGVVRFLRIPGRRFVRIDGEGPAGAAAFTPRMPGLYTVAWGLRFTLKRRGVETRVAPLDGLWWTVDGTTDLDAIFGGGEAGDRAGWRWILQIALPDEATADELDAALAAGRSKLQSPFAESLRIERFEEGDVAQLLHVGPYAAERPSIERLHAAIAEAGLVPRDRHHEVYLGDPQRSAPERLRTLLRQPVEAR